MKIRSLRQSLKKNRAFADYTMLFIVLFLLLFGLVILYSVSAYDGNVNYGDSSYFLRRQLISTIIGLGVLFLVSRIPYHVYERMAQVAYILSYIVILLIIPFGSVRNGAKRWIIILGLSFQPAEAAKLGMIIFLAYFICKLGRGIRTWKGLGAVALFTLPVCLLIYGVTSNLSSAIIVFGIAFVMVFVASPDYKRYILIVLGGVALIALAVFIMVKSAESGVGGFRSERVLAWLDPEAYASGKGFQTLQALYAIGSGGYGGKGLGESMQKLGFLPEAQNDMIFSIICEELGLFGALSVMALFTILIWRCMMIADNAPDLFGALLVVGVMAHIGIQVVLNIAVVTNVIPNTGISLPFISYGGSSVLFLLAEIGIVFSVGKGIELKDL